MHGKYFAPRLTQILFLLASVVGNAVAQVPTTVPAAAQSAAPEPDYHAGGHSWTDITTVAFSLDGRLVASADGHSEVIVWEIDSGRKVRSFQTPHWPLGMLSSDLSFPLFIWTGHSVNSLTFSPDSRLLAAEADLVTVWEVDTGRKLYTRGSSEVPPDPLYQRVAVQPGRSLSAPPGLRFRGVAISPDGRLLATQRLKCNWSRKHGCEDEVVIWELNSGLELRTLPVTETDIHDLGRYANADLRFSPDGKQLASVSAGGVEIWDVGTWSPAQNYSAPSGAVQEIAFSPDGKWLGANVGKSLVVWDTAGNQPARILTSQVDLGNIAFGPDARWLAATGGRNNGLVFWEVQTGRILRTLPYVGYPLGVSPDGRVFALAPELGDGRVQLVDAATGILMRTFPHASLPGFYGDWRILRTGATESSATPPEGMPIRLEGDARKWQFFTVQVDLENHSDSPADFDAPDGDVVLVREVFEGDRFPLMFVLPSGGPGTVEWSLTQRSSPILAGGYRMQAPGTAIKKVLPHAKVSMLLVFAAPKKFGKFKMFVRFGGIDSSAFN